MILFSELTPALNFNILLLLKACRGFKAEDPAWDLDEVDSCVQVDALPESVKEEGVCVVTPAGADFIVCYAAANG